MKSETVEFLNIEAVVSDGLKVLTSLPLMKAYQKRWTDLDLRSQANLVWFQSFAWCFNWMLIHGDKQTPFVMVLIENNRAVAVLPLMKSRNRLGMQMLRMIGEPNTQYGNILTENGTLTLAQQQLFKSALAERGSFDGLICNYVPEGSPLEQVLGQSRPLSRLDNQSLVIELTKFETPEKFSASLSKNMVKNLRRRRKHLEDMGDLSFTVLRPADIGFADAVDLCMAMKQQWLSETGRLSVALKQSGHATFLKHIEQNPRSGDGSLVFVLSVGGKPIAIELGFLQRRHYYSYIGAFDWNLRQHAPGRIQMHETICWLIQNGCNSMDLLANPTDYKRDIANRSIALRSFAISHNLRGTVYTSFWAGWGKPQLKRAIAAIPERWRAGLTQTRKLELNAGSSSSR